MRLPAIHAPLALALLASPCLAQCGDYVYKISPPVPSLTTQFGRAVGLSGGTILVGEPEATGLVPISGAAYVYDKASGSQTATLFPADGVFLQQFGASLDLDGNLAVIGAWGDPVNGDKSGAAYLYDLSTGSQLFKLVPNDGQAGDRFGKDVAISGTTILVGTYSGRGAYLFDATTGSQITKLLAPGPAGEYFGFAVALHGTTAIVGAPGTNTPLEACGIAHVYDATTFASLGVLRPATPRASAFFGSTLDIHNSTAIAGNWPGESWNDKSAHLFDLNSMLETFVLRPLTSSSEDGFGLDVAITEGRAIVGNSSAYWNDSSWEFPSAHLFDTATGIQLHEYEDDDFTFGDGFGASVAIEGDSVLVGAPYDYLGGASDDGVYLYDTSAAFAAPGYCDVRLNGTGQRAIIQACGSPSISANDFNLTVNWLPNKTYLFFHGRNQTQSIFGHGFLCVTGDIIRLGPAQVATGYSGSSTMNLPQEISTPGTRHFQCWFRDSFSWGAPFNLSNGLSVTFVP